MAREFDHRMYGALSGTPSGRTPSQPEMQRIRHGGPNPHRSLVESTDFREIELRVLAQMLDESPGKIDAALKNLEARGLIETLETET